MFKFNRITSKQQSAESCSNIICWLRINHDQLEARCNETLFYQNKCKYIVKEKRVSKYITNNLGISYDDSSEKEDSTQKTSDEKKKLLMKKIMQLNWHGSKKKNDFNVGVFFEEAICIAKSRMSICVFFETAILMLIKWLVLSLLINYLTQKRA